jgi:hypothetical protein
MLQFDGQSAWWAQLVAYTHCTAVRQIVYHTVVAHTIIIETSYANRALEVYQMALHAITI